MDDLAVAAQLPTLSLRLFAGTIVDAGRLANGIAAPVPVPEPTELAIQFYQTGQFVWAAGRILAVAIPALIIWAGLSRAMRGWAIRRGGSLGSIPLFTAAFLGARFIILLPYSFYVGFVRLHEYGLSIQSFGRWTINTAIAAALETSLVLIVISMIYPLIRRFPRSWWLWASVFVVPPLLTAGAFLQPIVVDPLFNRFTRMKNAELETRILALADQVGIAGTRVFEVDKSRDTHAVNAYVTGVFGSKRIVLWDTLLEQLDPDEVLAVVGHEIGHYVLGHVVQGLTCAWVLITIGLLVIHAGSVPLLERWSRRLGTNQRGDIGSLPLLVMLAMLYSVVAIPAGNAFGRHLERQADQFSLEITGDNHAAAMAFVKLQNRNLAIPRPGRFYTLMRASHPSLAERIEYANRYRRRARVTLRGDAHERPVRSRSEPS